MHACPSSGTVQQRGPATAVAEQRSAAQQRKVTAQCNTEGQCSAAAWRSAAAQEKSAVVKQLSAMQQCNTHTHFCARMVLEMAAWVRASPFIWLMFMYTNNGGAAAKLCDIAA